MIKKLSLLLGLQIILVWVGYGQPVPKTVMLVLGSHQAETIRNRVQAATRLYKTEKVDKIIVSGGCGAHASSLCEATEMKRQLTANGIPEQVIYKEENSKTTAQNYVFSRVLKDENGDVIIQKNDRLFVVSDHWHAIAVAARFNKYDGVNARFFIEGNIAPKANDPLDYVGIFNKIPDNVEFILKNTWPTPSAVYHQQQTKAYIFEDRVYVIDGKDSVMQTLSTWRASLPESWKNRADAVAFDLRKQQSIWFQGKQCLLLSKSGGVAKNNKLISLEALVDGLPKGVNTIDAAFFRGSELYLFAKDKLYIARKSGKNFILNKTESLKQWVPDWPYAWGDGDVAAADFDEESDTVYLYKNREVLKFNLNQNASARLQKLNLKWQNLNQ